MAVPVIHKISHWIRGEANEYNEPVFADPVEVTAFWIDEEQLRRDVHGEDFVSMARILTVAKVFTAGDRVQFVALADADKAKSFIVRRTKFVENGRQTSRLFTALLGKD